MNEHITHWLGAYHDGELAGRRLRQVENHLEQCSFCQAELDRLQTLSSVLQESFATAPLTTPERFTQQVNLRLPRRPALTPRQRALQTIWHLIPVGLFGAWAFIQTGLIVLAVVMGALGAGIGAELAAEWLPAGFTDLWVVLAVNLVFLTLIALLFWSWLAGWWVINARRSDTEA